MSWSISTKQYIPAQIGEAWGGGAYSLPRIAFYSIGESIDLAKLDGRVTDLINAFGSVIP